MKRHTLISILALAFVPPIFGDDAPKLDPKAIINESSGFLKEKEPEMTAEEYALYAKVVDLLSANPEFALRLLEGMTSDKEQPSPAFQFILGNGYYAAGQYDKAEVEYLSAIKRYPAFLRAWTDLGVLYYSAKRFGDAIPCFAKSIDLGDRDSSTFGMLGYCLEKQGNLVSAEMAYMQALGGDPLDRDWEEGLLRLAIGERQFGRAESLVKNLIKENPAETRYWLTYANVLISEDRKLEATVLLEVAAEAGVAGTDELNMLGDLYAEQNLVPEAAAIYAKLQLGSPGLGEKKLLRFAQVLISEGRLEAAEGVLKSVPLQLTQEGEVDFHQTEADLFAARKKWPEARRELEALLKAAPLNGRALLSLGRAYAAEGNLTRATFAFEAAYNIANAKYAASLELANIELKHRHYAETVEYLQKALDIEKSDEVEDYLARVKTLVGTDSLNP